MGHAHLRRAPADRRVCVRGAGTHRAATVCTRACDPAIARIVDDLVPRTRSSRISCREFDRELRVQRGTRIIELLVVLDSEVRKRGCRTYDANFGIGPLGAV